MSRTGLNEWFSKTKTYEQAESIKYLDEILKKAVYNHHGENEHPKKGDEKSTLPIKEWGLAVNQFAILFDGRVPL